MDKHGTATWSDITASLRTTPSCGKLDSYWTYEGCRYDKGSLPVRCPTISTAALCPRPRLRNGRLNQTAYNLHLFVRDIAGSVHQNRDEAAPGQIVFLRQACVPNIRRDLVEKRGVGDPTTAKSTNASNRRAKQLSMRVILKRPRCARDRRSRTASRGAGIASERAR